jgi:hypothetical protein
MENCGFRRFYYTRCSCSELLQNLGVTVEAQATLGRDWVYIVRVPNERIEMLVDLAIKDLLKQSLPDLDWL